MTDAHPSLSAVYVNCTLKRSPEVSNTAALIERSVELVEAQGVSTTVIRAVDRGIAPGMEADLRDKGWPDDGFPELWPTIRDADILVLAGPIWLGEQSSVSRLVLERIYARSDETNDKGQSVFYGKVAGAIVDGNEDGVKHVASNVLWSLAHLGYTIPPQPDSGWIGEIGPGPSYLDEGSGGPENDYTTKTIATMSWNLVHLARILASVDGYPAEGNLL